MSYHRQASSGVFYQPFRGTPVVFIYMKPQQLKSLVQNIAQNGDVYFPLLGK